MKRRLVTWALRVAAVGRGVVMRALPLRLRAVKVVIRRPDGRVLLVRHSYGSGAWLLPGGLVRRGESFVEGARREIAEELEIAGPVEAWRLAAVYTDRFGLTRQRVGLVVFEGDAEPMPNHEIAEARFVDPGTPPADTSPATLRRLGELNAPGFGGGVAW